MKPELILLAGVCTEEADNRKRVRLRKWREEEWGEEREREERACAPTTEQSYRSRRDWNCPNLYFANKDTLK